MRTQNPLVQESVEVAQRKERERMARANALRKFHAEQSEIEYRKVRNRAVLAVALAVIVSAWMFAYPSEPQSAHQGEILIKSELSKNQIKNLNIVKPVTERR